MAESLIAISIIIIILLAAATVAIQSLASVSFISDRLIAAQLAQEGIEIVENIRANNVLSNPSCGWSTGLGSGIYRIDINYQFLGCSSSHLINYSNYQASPVFLRFSTAGGYGRYSYNADGALSRFNRRIEINRPNAPASSNEVKINSIVEWVGKGGVSFSVNVEKHLFNYL